MYQIYKVINMSALTVRLPNNVIDEVNSRAKKLHITRSEYIRQSIENMNKKLQQKERKDRFIKASKLVRKESIIVNAEFSKVEYEPKD
jgi:metal-responsive CopG/Arc/MetJ family transcriptional regulator